MIDAPESGQSRSRARASSACKPCMRERGLGGLIVYYGGQHNMLRIDQLFYLTDFRTLGPAVLLVPVDGRADSWCSRRRGISRARARPPASAKRSR